MAGLDAALRFQEAIGIDRIAARVRELRRHLSERLRANPRVQLVSPPDERMAAGMVSFKVQGIESLELQRRLSDIDGGDGHKLSVRTRVIGEYDYGFMRLSAHVYNSPAELDTVARLIDVASRNG